MERLLATDPRRHVAGVVHPQLEAARQVALGLRQLGLTGTASSRSRTSSPRIASSAAGSARRIDAGRDLEAAGVGVLDEPRRHVVGQPELLADRQEQPAAHPVAKDGVEDGQCPAVGMIAAQSRDAEAELGLARVALAEAGHRGRPAGRRGVEPGTAPLPLPKAAAASVDRLLVTEVAGHRHDGIRRPVHRLPELVDRVLGQGQDVRFLAADLAAQRAVAEHRRLEQDLAVLGRVVEVGADLLDDHRALALDVGPSSRGRTISSPMTSIARSASRPGTRTQ